MEYQSYNFKNAWVTLLTRTSYLTGAVLLARSLHKHKSDHPLLILVTPSLPTKLLPILAGECKLTNAYILPIQPLSPPPENTPDSLIASRFEDTWTKLRVFELHKHGLEKLVFLDADMLVMRNMDELFDFQLPKDWIAANHACACNLDNDPWYAPSWTVENCAYTGLGPLDASTTVPKPGEGKETHALLNSGLFIFTPFQEQWEGMLHFLNTDTRVKDFKFPDQDFLALYFDGRWKSLSWMYNALKTMRYWHERLWRDEEVRNLHYIVDKPWNKRIGSDGKAGYLGNDGITHSWWWREYDEWEKERIAGEQTEILEMVREFTAKS